MFHTTIGVENLFSAWRTFKRGKNKNADLKEFAFSLEDHIFELHRLLTSKEWKPDAYIGFYLKDPKLRHIHKASVRDRVLYQAVFQMLEPVFEPYFIAHSYSSRNGKGTHAGVQALESFARKASRNWTRPVYALSGDIRKFFDTVDHTVLESLIARRISDRNVLDLVHSIISSFASTPGKGLPLGNVTSQLFANVYLNEFDQFAKRGLKARHYARYCDDFVLVSKDAAYLNGLLPSIANFLGSKLRMELHPRKIELRAFSQGIDFLGYVIRPHHRVFRTSTKHRIFRNMSRAAMALTYEEVSEERVAAMAHSYQGLLTHCSGHGLSKKLDAIYTPEKPG